MAQPTDEDVEQVIAFTGFTDRGLILSALKAKNNNLDQVVNEIYDDRTKFIATYGWDDKAFAANREGTPNSQIPTFAIHAADDGQVIQGVDPNYYQGQIGAPSRPPSRTNNRSPLSKLVDYAADSNSGAAAFSNLDGMLSNKKTGAALPPTSVEQEDAELQRAIEASVAASNLQSPLPQPQETGVTDADTSLPHFGPANRPDYNQNEWAMITLNHDKPDPDPSRRKREPGVPAFLRSRTENMWEVHRLGAIVTILHSIPLARNALLRFGVPPAQGYGHNPEWWKGKPIVPPAVQATHEAGELTWADDSKPVWSHELHRLMAFLDATDRCYGTTDVLGSTQPDGSLASHDAEKDFFEYLRSDPDKPDQVQPFVSTCEITNLVDAGSSSSFVNHFSVLDFAYQKEQLELADSLYNLWDHMFFMDYTNWTGDVSTAQCALITEKAEVLAMRFSGDDGLPKLIDIPSVFYLDRYLACNRDLIIEIQQNMHILARGLVRAGKAERRATICVDPVTGRELSKIDLNRGAIAKMKMQRALVKQWALWRMHEEEKERTGVEPHFLPPDDTPDDKINWTEDEQKYNRFFEAKIRHFENELARVEDEVSHIHRQRDRIRRCYRKYQRRLTAPCETLGFDMQHPYHPQHAYTLRGVANKPDTFYVCFRAEPDLMEMDDHVRGPKSPGQWWKLGYVANEDEPIKAEMTTYEKVMEEACGIGSKPLLIYASDKAMSEDLEPLSDALQLFVRFDNRLFKQELAQEIPRDKKRGGFTSPASPSKRLNRSSSADSMATNAASAGDFDDDMRDAPFEAEDPFLLGDGVAVSEPLPDLIDASVPETPASYYGEPQTPAQPNSGRPEMDGDRDHPIEIPSASSSTASLESVRRMANVSLDEVIHRPLPNENCADGRPAASPRPVKASARSSVAMKPDIEHQQTQSKGPEMQERGGATSPFFLRGAANGKPVTGGSVMDMELDEKAHGERNDG